MEGVEAFQQEKGYVVVEWSEVVRIRTLFIFREKKIEEGVNEFFDAQLPISVDIDCLARLFHKRQIQYTELEQHCGVLLCRQVTVTVDVQPVVKATYMYHTREGFHQLWIVALLPH